MGPDWVSPLSKNCGFLLFCDPMHDGPAIPAKYFGCPSRAEVSPVLSGYFAFFSGLLICTMKFLFVAISLKGQDNFWKKMFLFDFCNQGPPLPPLPRY